MLPTVEAALRANPVIEEAVGATVGEAVTQLLGDTGLWQALDETAVSLIGGLLGDAVVQQAVQAQVAAEVSTLLGGGVLGQTVGAQVGAAVVGLVTDPVVGAALAGLVDTVASDFFGGAGVIAALADAAGELASAAVRGDLDTVLPTVEAALRADPAIDAALGATVADAVTQLLGDTGLVDAVASTVTTLTEQLAGNTSVQAAVGREVSALVESLLAGNPAAAAVGAAVADAVVGLLADGPFVDGVAEVVTTVVTTFLGQEAVPSTLGATAGRIAVAVMGGTDLTVALQEALRVLEADPVILAALSTTITAALDVADATLLSNPDVQRLLGSTVTTVIEQLAAIPDVRTAIGELLGPDFGPPLVELLADSTFVDDVAVAFGTIITDLLAYPGFNGALTDAINQTADALLAGADPSAAINAGLAALEANPAYRAAVNAAVPSALNSLLSNPAVRQAVSTAAKSIVTDLLRTIGIGNGFIDGLAGQVVEVTVDSFLAKPAAKILVDGIAVDVLVGMPLSDATNSVIQAVLRDPALQVALGTSLGEGIGSLFGDNLVGLLIGGAAGITATVVIGIASGLTLLFTGGGPVVGAAAATDAKLTEGHFFETVTVPGDLFVMTAVMTDPQVAAVLREAVATDGGLVLTEMTVTGPEENEAEALDIQMAIGAAANAEAGQMRVGFRFSLDELLGVPVPARSLRVGATSAERVG